MSETVLIEIRPRQPADAAEVQHRFSRGARGAAHFSSQYWPPKVIALPSWQQDIGFTGEKFGQLALPQVGQLQVAAEAIDPALIWRGAKVEIRRAPWSTGVFGTVERYRVQRLSIADGVASIHLMDTGADLDLPVSERLFGSTGVAVLDDPINVDLIGKTVPTGWGRIFNAPGYLVDRAYNIWLVLGRASAVIHGIYDGGAAFAAGVSRADLTALRANVPDQGKADFCGNAGGLTLVRPWTTPAYPLTADITAAGSSNTAAGIAAAIIAARSSLAMAAGTVAALDALNSATCGVYVDDETTISTALDFLITGLGCWWGLDAAGDVELGRIDWGTPAATFASYQVESIEREETVFPSWARGVGYARLAKTHSEGEIATALLAGDITGLGDLAMLDSVDWALQVTGAGKPEDGATRNNWRGIHNSSLTYDRGDEVSNAASDRMYRAKSAVPAGIAVTNTAYWDLTLVSGGGAAGDNALSARLTNPTILVPTAADGSGGTYTGLTSQVEFYDGTVRKDATGLVTFSLVGSPAWASVSSTGLITIGDWGATRVELKVDCTYGALTLRVTMTLIRTLQGVQGPSIALTGGGAFEYVDGVATAGQTRTFTAALSGITGTVVWTTTPLGITLSGSGNSRTLAVADMGSNRQVTVRATISGLYDEDTAIRVDRSTAAAGATVGSNELDQAAQDWLQPPWGSLVSASVGANSAAGGWGTPANPQGRCLFLQAPADNSLSRAVTNTFYPAAGVDKLWVDVRSAWGGTAPTRGFYVYLWWYDAAGAVLLVNQLGALDITGAAGVYVRKRFVSANRPTGAAYWKIGFYDDGQLAATAWRVDTVAITRTQPAADVTGENTSANTLMVGSALASVLVTDAATAKSNAAAALADLAVIASDAYLTKGEKPRVIREVEAINAEYSVIVARATALSLTAHATYTSWVSARSALNSYLAGLSPAWNNTTLDTAIVAATFKGRFNDYYYAREAVLDLFVQSVNSAATNAYNAAVAAAALANDAQAAADGKVQTFYSTGAPVAEALGDLWFDTDDGYKLYRWSGSAWLAVQDTRIAAAISLATGAQDTADGKAATFFAASAPVAEGVGDLWYNTATAVLSRWDGSSWVLVATANRDRGAWSSLANGAALLVGDEVQDAGSTWGCILAHSKSAGNGPPTLPTASNTYWRLRAAAGSDGVTTSGGISLTIACADNGTVKAGELPRDFSVKLLKGGTDITSSATWTIVNPTNVSLSVQSAGVIRLTAISANSGSATIRGAISGVNFDIPFSATKSIAGSPAAGVGAALTFPTTSVYALLGTTGELAVPAGRAVNVNAALDWLSTGSTSVSAYAEVSSNAGGAWSALGSAVSGSTFVGEPSGTVNLNEVIASSPSARSLMVRIWGRRTGSNFTNTSGVLGMSLA